MKYTNAGSRPFRTNIAVILATLDAKVRSVPTIINNNKHKGEILNVR